MTDLAHSAWVLGAGFSKPFGMPLASELHAAALAAPVDPSMADLKSCLADAAPAWDVLRAYFAEEEL
jgi:hypothetical protein